MSSLTIPRIQPLLVKWFRKDRRDLPWRRTQDPYAIWVSEIMLQQTQVNTVIPYYHRWMKNFPTVRSLSRSRLGKVLKAWEGLGYYSRARNLHRAAKIIARDKSEKFPETAEEWKNLPGIGRYTAGAITSIAFNQPEAILDGNVKRVLSRIFAVREPIDQPVGEERLWKIANSLVVGTGLVPALRRAPTKGAPTSKTLNHLYGDFNQSLMELGAVVCLPENPKCGICPVQKMCKAKRMKKQTDFPVKARKVKLEKLRTLAAVIWKEGQILLEKRPLTSRWGGLWAFPHWTFQNGKKELEFLRERVKEDLGMEIKDWRNHSEIRHGFTKYDVRLRVYEGTFIRHPEGRRPEGFRDPSAASRPQDDAVVRWIDRRNLSKLALPRPHQKIAKLIEAHA